MGKKGIYIATGIVFALLSATIVWQASTKTKIRYVNFVELYDNFGMKKELEEGFKKSQTSQMAKLDSAKAELSVLSQKLQAQHTVALEEEFTKKRQLFYYQQKSIEGSQEEQMMQYKEQILKRLKQYVAEYAKEKSIDVLLGQDEGFSNLYVHENLNVTTDLLKYVNEKYKGTK